MSNVPLPPSEPKMKAHTVGTYDIPAVETPPAVEPVRTPAAAVPPPVALPPEPAPVEPTRRGVSWVWWLVLVIVLLAVLWWAWSALRPSNAGRMPAAIPAAGAAFATHRLFGEGIHLEA